MMMIWVDVAVESSFFLVGSVFVYRIKEDTRTGREWLRMAYGQRRYTRRGKDEDGRQRNQGWIRIADSGKDRVVGKLPLMVLGSLGNSLSNAGSCSPGSLSVPSYSRESENVQVIIKMLLTTQNTNSECSLLNHSRWVSAVNLVFIIDFKDLHVCRRKRVTSETFSITWNCDKM